MNKDLIKSITIKYGGFHSGVEQRTVTHNGENILVDSEFYNGLSDDGRELYKNKTWSQLLAELEMFHIDTWDKDYDDPDVMDGTQWSLVIEYTDGSEGIQI